MEFAQDVETQDVNVGGDIEVTGTATLNAVTLNEAVDLPENSTIDGTAIGTGSAPTANKITQWFCQSGSIQFHRSW